MKVTIEHKDGYEIRTYETGTKRWYKDGVPHRTDGPAYIKNDQWGTREQWYINGERVSSEEEFELLKRKMLKDKIENILKKDV